jgi:transposase
VATITVTRRFDLTDGQWAVLEPLLLVAKRAGRPSKWTKRQLIDGIRWRVRVRAGAQVGEAARCGGVLRGVFW